MESPTTRKPNQIIPRECTFPPVEEPGLDKDEGAFCGYPSGSPHSSPCLRNA